MTKYNLNWSYEVEETESYPTPHQQDQEDNITRSSVLPYKNDSSLQYLIDFEYFSIVVLFKGQSTNCPLLYDIFIACNWSLASMLVPCS